MIRKDGEYYYAPHRKSWGVWQNHNHGGGVSSGTFIKDFPTKELARIFVYGLNGWAL